jgi:hypothetical protein
MSIYILKGPYGTRIIEVYDNGCRGALRTRLRPISDAKRVCIQVTDEDSSVVADAICDVDNPEIEEARQWLLDFARCSL